MEAYLKYNIQNKNHVQHPHENPHHGCFPESKIYPLIWSVTGLHSLSLYLCWLTGIRPELRDQCPEYGFAPIRDGQHFAQQWLYK